MAETVRERIVDAIVERMEKITKEQGYGTDIGKVVLVWPGEAVEATEAGIVIVKDVACETEPDNFKCFRHALAVEVSVVFCGDDCVKNARRAIGDVMEAIGEDMTWGGLALLTNKNSDEMSLETKTVPVCVVRMVLQIIYRTQGWDEKVAI
jgi:hypothetical protein